MEKYIYKGFLSVSDNGYDDEIRIDDEALIEKIDNDVFEGIVNLRYAVSDKIIENIDVAFTDLAMKLEGELEVEYSFLWGSEWTGCYGLDEILIVGGHNFLDEVYKFAEKGLYIYLEIAIKEVDTE